MALMTEDGDGIGRFERCSSTCDEARHTLTETIDRIENSDQKAIWLFRSNIFLIGLLLTAFSIVVDSNGIPIDNFINNIWSFFGSLLLIASTVVAAMAYTSSSYDVGVSTSFVNSVVEDQHTDEDEFHDNLLELYQDWMDHNKNVYKFNSHLVTLSITLMTWSILLFAGGAIIGLMGSNFTLASLLLFGAAVVVLMAISSLIYFAEDMFLWAYDK
jgi:uncharacterized membrane protein YcjF (UPF0283 family)